MNAQESTVPHTLADAFTLQDDPGSSSTELRCRRSESSSRRPQISKRFAAGLGLPGMARRTLGILLLLVTVFLWTGSNFLASVSPPR
jgi:hypothetical protein